MNRLAGETSPYLRQHADNPVDWYPWSDEAFAAARELDRPVLLSIGYSACHWCHVMAHESFENPEIAAAMNRLFVNVKVDREERPDIDAIYMQAVQALTGRGGWPMTVFLTPDGRPFFGGTYFPDTDRHGSPGFPRVLDAVDEAWRERRDEVLVHAGQLHGAIDRSLQPERNESTPIQADGETAATHAAALDRAVEGLQAHFDARFGGFGGAPKFPPAMAIDVLLRRHVVTGSPEALKVATVTLDAMAAGGIYDQIGGGFHRYSVDAHWLVPHFEKMLYDQALLCGAYLRGWLVTGTPRYREVVEATIDYVLSDLRHPDGGLFSARDADSEGIEGKFYLWSREELTSVCGTDAEEVIAFFGVTDGGNFVDPHTKFSGNILHAVDRNAARPEAVRRASAALLAARAQRVAPGLDDKVLLGWNALFLRSLTEAAAVFERSDWMDAARANARFLSSAMRRPDGRRLRSWKDGHTHVVAFAEDYAALLEALVTLAELVELFADHERGGVFTTGTDAEALIVRPKDIQDGPIPSENSLAASGLLRLAALTGEARYEDAARRWIDAMTPIAITHPNAFPYLLGAIERSASQPLEIAIVGERTDPTTTALRRVVIDRVVPNAVLLVAAPGDPTRGSPLLEHRVGTDAARRPPRATAYVCRGYACDAPVHDAQALEAALDTAIAQSAAD